MKSEIQEKMNSLSQAERLLFGAFCRLINETLYDEEGELGKMKAKDLDGLFQSISDAANLMHLLRVIDLVMDVAADLACEQSPKRTKDIEANFLAAKAQFLSECLWSYEIGGPPLGTAKRFFSSFERLLQEEVGE